VLAELSDPRWLEHVANRTLRADQLPALAASWRRVAAGDVSYQDVALLDELGDLLGESPHSRRGRDSRQREADPYVVDGQDTLTGAERGDDQAAGGPREVTSYAERAARRSAAEVDVEETGHEYAHVVVDEAQDLSPMQWRMLGRRGRYATWTVVGDAAQSSWQDPDAAAEAMNAALGKRTRREFELTVNYRNPHEIAVLADALLRAVTVNRSGPWSAREPGATRPAHAVRSSGRPPRLVTATDGPATDLARLTDQAVTELLADVEGTIGVIVPMSALDDATHWPDAHGWPSRAQVIGALDAKGLEFDAVVLVDAARVAAESPAGLRTLYVAVTRATQALLLVPPVPQVLADVLSAT
jgi:hypothetical protein